MQRSMSYDLDGIFASRNQGQLLSGGTHVRTPGLQQVASSAYRQGCKIPVDGLGIVQIPKWCIRYGRKFVSPGAAAAWAKSPGGAAWIRAQVGRDVSGYTEDRTMRLNGPDDDVTTSSDVDDQSTVPGSPVPGAPAAVEAPVKSNTKLYLALGAAAAAYFLFFRK